MKGGNQEGEQEQTEMSLGARVRGIRKKVKMGDTRGVSEDLNDKSLLYFAEELI